MLVYGDPSETLPLPGLAARLGRALAAATSADGVRHALVAAGEVEQAVADAGLDLGFAALTDALARALVSGAPVPPMPAGPFPPVRVRVKVPEGFAFYALYPEQYADAARRWLAAHPPGRALVVGVRSIGTTLSAVVAATLSAAGHDVTRVTVRPSGHPFERRVEVGDVAGFDRALVVDEGPGLSGSSMAAVARALLDAGVRDVALLPGHGGEPGPAASDEVRHLWATLPRWIGDAPEVGPTLTARTGDVVRVDDLGGGRWAAGTGAPAFARFEAPKIRCVRRDGSAILWKFLGLHADAARLAARLAARAAWTPAPVDATLGYVGLPWVEGARLGRRDARPPEVLRYVEDVAGPPLTRAELDDAVTRLRHMLSVNAPGAFALDPRVDDRRAAGDGRLAPHEWIRTPAGRLVKTDAAGHDADHTLVGRQPVAWDRAGAAVEWGEDDAPAFWRAAYAAFRLGMCEACGVDGAWYADALRRAVLSQG